MGVCSLCEGRGTLRHNVASPEGYRFGRIPCKCMRGQLIASEEQIFDLIATNRRLRIAHLRRMVSSIPGAIERTQWLPAYTEQEFEHKKWRRRDRFTRFAKACNAEIARLRGEG